MTRTRLLVIGGILAAVIAVGAMLAISYIQQLTAPKPLTISYETVQTAMPEGAVCAGGSDESGGVAKEILNLQTDDIYVAGGVNPMPDDVWADYRFGLPLLKNSTRNLLFDGSCFFRSPDAPADCEGDACFTIEEIVSYTWLKLTTVAGNDCYPDASGCSGDTVNPGYVSVNTIAKCHRITYEGPTIYELSDGRGNVYVMHATATGIPDVTGPILPEGWTLRAVAIDAPLEVLPFGGGDTCYFNVIRDNLVQAYHQIAYAGSVFPPVD
jgi:hypothetical protein